MSVDYGSECPRCGTLYKSHIGRDCPACRGCIKCRLCDRFVKDDDDEYCVDDGCCRECCHDEHVTGVCEECGGEIYDGECDCEKEGGK